MNDLMTPVDEVVQNILLSAIIGETISEKERILFTVMYSKLFWPYHYLQNMWCYRSCNTPTSSILKW